MSAQPEALRLALEALEMSRRFVYADNRPQCDEAIDALRAALAQQDEPVQEPVATLIAQRDALLEALKDATKTIEHLGYPLAAIERARAAIKAVEGEKK